MISTAWPRFSSSRLRPYTTSPSPPACATGAHSDDTMTMYMTLPDAGGENRHKRRVKSLPHRTIARERLGLRLADRDGADVLVREHLGHLCDTRLRLHGDDRRRHHFAGGDRVDWPLALCDGGSLAFGNPACVDILSSTSSLNTAPVRRRHH